MFPPANLDVETLGAERQPRLSQWATGPCYDYLVYVKKAIPVFIQRQACYNVSTDDSIYSPKT